jgi:hypothetical protein
MRKVNEPIALTLLPTTDRHSKIVWIRIRIEVFAWIRIRLNECGSETGFQTKPCPFILIDLTPFSSSTILISRENSSNNIR